MGIEYITTFQNTPIYIFLAIWLVLEMNVSFGDYIFEIETSHTPREIECFSNLGNKWTLELNEESFPTTTNLLK